MDKKNLVFFSVLVVLTFACIYNCHTRWYCLLG